MEKISELPRYKSSEFYVNFKYGSYDPDLIEKLKKDGELNAKTIVKMEPDGSKSFRVTWKRKTRKGKENIALLVIYPSDGFLEFVDKFLEKRGFLEKYWQAEYGVIFAACQLCAKDQNEFKKLVRKAENTDEILIVYGLR